MARKRKKEKEFFTIMILSGPKAQVRTFRISKPLIKTLSLLAVTSLVFSMYFAREYNIAKDKACELQSVREELMQQKAEVQNFALNILDYKRQMFFLRDLDTKLRRVVSLSPRGKAQQVLGIGGPSERGLQDLATLGKKNQSEALQEMHQELTQLKGAASRQETSLQTLIEYFEDKRSLFASTPTLWPIRGWVTSPFGRRISPFTGNPAFHEGLDIAAQTGTPIKAPADGMVVRAGYYSGYGNMVELSHGYGIKTVYGHNSRLNVKVGQMVKRGEIIGFVGDTGSSTGPHLHYEVRLNSVPVNPRRYLP